MSKEFYIVPKQELHTLLQRDPTTTQVSVAPNVSDTDVTMNAMPGAGVSAATNPTLPLFFTNAW